jgi:hypothetical protein
MLAPAIRARRADLERCRFHDLRHRPPRLLLAAGVHPKVVQERLGHATVSITLDSCSHVLGTLQREAADKVDELLGGYEAWRRPRGTLRGIETRRPRPGSAAAGQLSPRSV